MRLIVLTLFIAGRLYAAESSSLVTAVLGPKDDADAVVRAIEQGGDCNTREGGRSLAALAAGLGKIKTLEALLLAGADPGGSALYPEPPALIEAIRKGRKEAVALLLEFGANPRESTPDGVTPLLTAVESGNEQIVTLLMEAGVVSGPGQRGVRDRAVTAARTAKREALSRAIDAFDDPSIETDTLDALRPLPGANLEEISLNARDGQTLLLQEGEYTGPLFAGKKSLRVRGMGVKTVIKSAVSPVAVYVENGGRLRLESVALQLGGKSTAGLLVAKGGEATVVDCEVSGAKQVGLQSEGGQLTVIGTRIIESRAGVHITGVGAIGMVRNCTLVGVEQGVSGENAERLHCTATLFKNVAQPFIAIGVGNVGVRRCDMAVRKTAQGGSALYLEKCGEAVLAENQMVSCDTGIYIAGAFKRTAFLRDNTILRATVGIAANLDDQSPPPVLTGNFIADARNGVLLSGAVRPVLGRNTVLCTDGIAVLLQKRAGVSLDRSTLTGSPVFALRGGDAARVKFTQTMFSGAFEGLGEDRLDESSRRLRIAAEGSEGFLLRTSAADFCAGLSKPDENAAGDNRAALQRVLNAVEAVRTAADGLALIELTGIDMYFRANALPAHIYADTGEAPEHLHVAPNDLVDPARLLATLRKPRDPLLAHLAAQPEFVALLAQPAAGNALREALAQALSATVDGAPLYTADRCARMKLHPYTKIWIELKNLQPEETRTFNRRLLEDALPGLLHPSRVLATTHSGRPALLPAGKYIAQYVFDSSRFARLTALSGGTQRAEIQFGDALWFRIQMSENHERPVLLRMKPQREIQELVARLVKPQDTPAVARPDITPAARKTSLALAWSRYSSLLRQGAPEEEPRRPLMLEAAERIFSALGDSTDARKLRELAEGTSPRCAGVISRIERRLGTLQTGELSSLLKSDSVAAADEAAVLLCYHGIESARSRVLEMVRSNRLLFLASRALMDTYSPEVLREMRVHISRQKATGYNALPIYVLLYMLAYGDTQDFKAVTELPFGVSQHSPYLALVADNTEPLAVELGYRGTNAATLAAMVCSASPEWAPPLLARIQQTCRDVENFHYNVAGRFPTNASAAMYDYDIEHPPEKKPLLFPHWLSPATATPAQILALLEEGKTYLSFVYLDRIDEKNLRASCAKVPGGDLILASYLAATQAQFAREELRDGVERRAFAFSGKDGSVIGHLEARPRLTNRTLSVNLRFKFALHYDKVLAIVFAHDYVFERPLHNDGRSLIGDIFIQKGERRLPLTFQRHENEYISFTAELDEESLDGWSLYIPLKYFSQSALCAYDLSATDHAWTLRRLRQREKRAEALIAANPKDVAPLLTVARLLEAQGRLDAAATFYQKALQLDPRRSELLFSLAAGYLAHHLPHRTAELLEGNLRDVPGDTEGWRLLAQAQFQAGQYAPAAKSALSVLKLEPGRRDIQSLRAMSLTLAGDPKTAAAELAELPADAQTPALSALRYIAARSARTGEEAARSALEKFYDDLPETLEKVVLGFLLEKTDYEKVMPQIKRNSDRCIAFCYRGFAARFRNGDSVSSFKDALATNEKSLLAWRLAAQALKAP